MRKYILIFLGINDILNEQKKTNAILLDLLKESKKNNALSEAYNRSYNIK